MKQLFAGAASPGGRAAAGLARDLILSRLREPQRLDSPVEYTFRLRDQWSYKLLIALLRRYSRYQIPYNGIDIGRRSRPLFRDGSIEDNRSPEGSLKR